MSSKKILIIATYPVKNPQHGGQKRTAAILETYNLLFNEVQFVAVFNKAGYKDYDSKDIPLSIKMTAKANANPLTGDIICGQAIYEDSIVKKGMTKLLSRLNPDIIHLEQPYTYLGLKPLLKELGMAPKLIFGSQNVEGPMKREILENAGYDDGYIDKAVKIIDDVERELAHDCALLVACTEEDLAAHRKMGAKRVVLAMNGIAPIVADESDIQYWEAVKADAGINKAALFVASAHPPSITGFLDVIGKGVGFLEREERIFMAGSVSDHFVEIIKPANINIADATFWSRVYPCGRLSEGRLTALLKTSDCILLPITEGGGSNLKTAEAIAADKKIVTTSYALRSFEWIKEFPNVWVADTKQDFQRAIKDSFHADFKQRTEQQREKARTVYWDYRLNDLKEEVKKICQE